MKLRLINQAQYKDISFEIGEEVLLITIEIFRYKDDSETSIGEITDEVLGGRISKDQFVASCIKNNEFILEDDEGQFLKGSAKFIVQKASDGRLGRISPENVALSENGDACKSIW
jgi:hypothetical protein